MSNVFDVIVVGLGAHGSAALYQLSRTGQKVLGIDRYNPPHNLGSSHGQSRIIRQAYHEAPFYVPLVKAAYGLWDEIEKTAGKKLLLNTGGIVLGHEDSMIVKGARLSADTHDIPYEYLDISSIKNRFPSLLPDPRTVAVLEKNAGILFPELCIQTFLEQAFRNGASIQYDEPITRIIPGNDAIEIVTAKASYYATRLVVSVGAWLNELMPELCLPLTVERQVLYWLQNRLETSEHHFRPDNLPVFLWEYSPGKIFYGFPDLGDGIKIAFHHAGESIVPGKAVPAASPEELGSIMSIAKRYLELEPVFNYSVSCMYTNTPDEHFIIDFHPNYSNIIIASPCSGHGFKFASLTGKILCDMATGKSTSFDLSPFRLARFN